MSDQLREFIGEDREAALAEAQSHFGVSADRLEVMQVPESLRISNLGTRTLLLVGPKPASEELGEVGEFVKTALELLGLGQGLKLTERNEDDGRISLRAQGKGLEEADRRVNGFESALSHLADRAAQALLDEDASAVVALQREGSGRARPGRDRDRGDRGDRGGRGRDRDRDRDRGRGRGGRDRDRDRRGGSGRREARADRPRSDAEEELENTARDAARDVQRGGDEKILPAMSSRERWVVHNAVKEVRGVNSESVGEGARRRVRIFAE